MRRTQGRPVPSGQVEPEKAAFFGITLGVAGFLFMQVFVNPLAAFLTLFAFAFYVIVYTLILKRSTPLNIVIGGAAGAMPPVIGWAAITNSISLEAILMFAIVTLWTPPHFWALAIVRKKDYENAGVPMLPVIRGEKETRSKILIYTLELVAVTLLLPIFNLAGIIYVLAASLLGAGLIYAAWKVWKVGGNLVAWKMYRWSSMYLAFIFTAIVVDAIL